MGLAGGGGAEVFDFVTFAGTGDGAFAFTALPGVPLFAFGAATGAVLPCAAPALAARAINPSLSQFRPKITTRDREQDAREERNPGDFWNSGPIIA